MSIIESLRNQKEFDLVNKHGTKLYGSSMILVLGSNVTYIPSTTPNPTFLGMKVSRKFSKKAVIRNKVKRRIRHLVHNIKKDPTLNTDNTAFIIIPKKGFDKTDFTKLKTDFYNVFTRVIGK